MEILSPIWEYKKTQTKSLTTPVTTLCESLYSLFCASLIKYSCIILRNLVGYVCLFIYLFIYCEMWNEMTHSSSSSVLKRFNLNWPAERQENIRKYFNDRKNMAFKNVTS